MRAALLFALLALSTTSYAADFMFAGAGTRSCGQYLEDIKNDFDDGSVSFGYTSWVQGFLSGANVARLQSGSNTAAIADAPAIRGYLAKWCTEHPLEKLLMATTALLGELPQTPARPAD